VAEIHCPGASPPVELRPVITTVYPLVVAVTVEIVPEAEKTKVDPTEIDEVLLLEVILISARGNEDAAVAVVAEYPLALQTPRSAFQAPPELDVPSEPEVVLLKLSEKVANAVWIKFINP
jgi:hypothetical protein